MSVKLRVKIKSLAAEAQFIRIEEQRAKVNARWARDKGKNSQEAAELCASLRNHRVHTVRSEARSTQLAYGYLRGRTYLQIEQSRRRDNSPDWDAIRRMVKRYSPGFSAQEFKAWYSAA